jgi:tetratricopeptide (TPR) repeat protein
MIYKKHVFFILFFMAGLSLIYAQNRSGSGRESSPFWLGGVSNEELIKTGISFYGEGKYSEAASILSVAEPSPEALYWLSLSELSSGNFNKALLQLEKLEKADPGGRWSAEVPYHRGRCFYYLGRNEEALASLKNFTEKLSDSDPRKGAAFYWQGESLMALGQFDAASNAFSLVVEKYPESTKYEA